MCQASDQPPSVGFLITCDLMCKIGQVVFLENTLPPTFVSLMGWNPAWWQEPMYTLSKPDSASSVVVVVVVLPSSTAVWVVVNEFAACSTRAYTHTHTRNMQARVDVQT